MEQTLRGHGSGSEPVIASRCAPTYAVTEGAVLTPVQHKTARGPFVKLRRSAGPCSGCGCVKPAAGRARLPAAGVRGYCFSAPKPPTMRPRLPNSEWNVPMTVVGVVSLSPAGGAPGFSSYN